MPPGIHRRRHSAACNTNTPTSTGTCSACAAFVQAARWLGKTDEAALWQKEYDDFLAAFRKAAARDMQTRTRRATATCRS